MSATIQAPPPVPSSAPPVEPQRNKRAGWALLVPGAFLLILAPVVLLASAGNPPCQTPTPGALNTAAGNRGAGGMYARPLKLKPGSWYQVGATVYGGPADPTSSSFGSIGGSQGYLPAHPDTFAELSVLDHNPANSGAFVFADANALDNLPYLTGLVVSGGAAKRILYKRDVGYGQGPGQLIANGQPYRLDVWWQSARALAVSKNAVKIALAPAVGAGQLLGQTPAGVPGAGAVANPACDQLAATGALSLTPGQRARILPDGSAAAPQNSPGQVKLAIAAGNEIDTKPYPSPDVHDGSLTEPWPAYDCSAATSYVLYKAGLHGSWPDVSGTLESWGAPGPGKWITVYANSGHAWVVVAGLAFDTADFGGPNIPAGSGPRWRQNPTANLADGRSYVVRHPPGL
jgi:hypothetical protein